MACRYSPLSLFASSGRCALGRWPTCTCPPRYQRRYVLKFTSASLQATYNRGHWLVLHEIVPRSYCALQTRSILLSSSQSALSFFLCTNKAAVSARAFSFQPNSLFRVFISALAWRCAAVFIASLLKTSHNQMNAIRHHPSTSYHGIELTHRHIRNPSSYKTGLEKNKSEAGTERI